MRGWVTHCFHNTSPAELSDYQTSAHRVLWGLQAHRALYGVWARQQPAWTLHVPPRPVATARRRPRTDAFCDFVTLTALCGAGLQFLRWSGAAD